ncbi:MAG: cyclic nucleotide-binding domain-containing protein [Alphaproteobacteria bacterium]|nr:cyclic nucleotide-binding domain-containing protein [Alphaproteobacteria bacterium]
MRTEDYARLKSVRLFQGLTPAQLDDLTANATGLTAPRGTQLFAQGDPPDHLHVVLHGMVALIGRGPRGEEAVIEFFGVEDVFLAAAVILDQPYLMAARVIEDSRLALIPAASVRRAIERENGVGGALAYELSRHWRMAIGQLKDLKLRPALPRLAAYLVELADPVTGVARLPAQRRLVAARLAMSPESLSRCFAALRTHGVEARGRNIRIADLGSLRRLSTLSAGAN